MKRLLFLLPLTLLLLFGCKEKRYFTEVTGDVYLSRISFEDESFRDFTMQPWAAYQGAPVAEAALDRGDMIVVLVAYDEWTAIPDILLAEHFIKEHDADLPGDSKKILTAAYFDFE